MNTTKKQRASQNRTLELTGEEFSLYQSRVLDVSSPVTWSQIKNKTIHGDLLTVMDFLPENFADLIIIDPPYNLSKNFSGMKFSRMKDDLYLEYLHSWFPRMVSFLKPNGSIYLCGDWKCTSALQTIINKYLIVLNRITWQREKGRGAKSNWKNSMEDIWFGVKNPDNYYFDVESVKIKRKVVAPYTSGGIPKDWEQTADGNFRVTYPSNFWDDITVPYWSMPENTDHPTQKPEKLIAKLILASCPPGGTVFDPFLGSGTTSVVAKKLGRNYCGVEINPEYCCWAEKRLDNADINPGIQGFSDGVFWERNSRPR
ncbi:MAG: site-specific DNA-methyltransferase [Dysgonamonadaceae bacterium]|jgi:site-specific DNA-methyltransferase (adenine-specific)|nr:site-specific DNA-methyltransferase [Dysgonamonadaceae bacterium]